MNTRRKLALVLGAGGWLILTMLWWAAHGSSPSQTVILWETYGLWEWIVEGVLLHGLVAGFIWMMWKE